MGVPAPLYRLRRRDTAGKRLSLAGGAGCDRVLRGGVFYSGEEEEEGGEVAREGGEGYAAQTCMPPSAPHLKSERALKHLRI